MRLATVFILGFAVLFGFLAIGLIDHAVNCPLSFINGGNCAAMSAVFASLAHHLSVAHALVQFTVNYELAALTVFIALFAMLLLFIEKNIKYLPCQNFIYIKLRAIKEFCRRFGDKEQFLFWSALHNKRDMSRLSRCV